MFNLKGKVAIITGGGGVLGGAMAIGLAQAGAQVALLGRKQKALDIQVEKIQALGGIAIGLSCDVLSQKTLVEVRTQIKEKWGQIDILVNAAGGNMAGATIMPDQSFFDLSLEDFRSVSQLNLDGTVIPSLVFGEEIAHSDNGSIINISSMTSQLPFTRVVGYSAAKAAVDNFTRWLSVEMAQKFEKTIRVNAIAPGVFIGAQNKRLLLNEDDTLTARGNTIIERTPMRRFGEPEELVSTVLYLCSPASSFVTGVVIPVDGGFSAFSGV